MKLKMNVLVLIPKGIRMHLDVTIMGNQLQHKLLGCANEQADIKKLKQTGFRLKLDGCLFIPTKEIIRNSKVFERWSKHLYNPALTYTISGIPLIILDSIISQTMNKLLLNFHEHSLLHTT